jgi:hypothetical protein
MGGAKAPPIWQAPPADMAQPDTKISAAKGCAPTTMNSQTLDAFRASLPDNFINAPRELIGEYSSWFARRLRQAPPAVRVSAVGFAYEVLREPDVPTLTDEAASLLRYMREQHAFDSIDAFIDALNIDPLASLAIFALFFTSLWLALQAQPKAALPALTPQARN